jgi:glucosylceramidase
MLLLKRAATAFMCACVAMLSPACAGPSSSRLDITVESARQYQEIDGIGGSITESSAWLMCKKMNAQQRHQLLVELFDRKEGIGLSCLRQPIGASDFRLSDYSYDDMPPGQEDFELTHFSIARDEETIIPVLKEALAINPDIFFIASPWSPPPWMKTSGVFGAGALRHNPRIMEAYANYIIKFIRAYARDGIPIHAITPQNEPDWVDWSYPSCAMSSETEAAFVKVLGRRFKEEGIATKIIIWDHNWNYPQYPLSVLADKDANPYIDGSAFHDYGGDASAQTQVHDAFPDKNIYFTEVSSSVWAPDFNANFLWDSRSLVIDAMRNWARTVVKWNIALDTAGGPKPYGGGPWCRGIVTIHDDGTVDKNADYYGLGHASKFVLRGAHRIETSSADTIGFENPDRGIVLLVCNEKITPQPCTIHWNGQSITVQLLPRSVTTLTWDRYGHGAHSWVTAGSRKKLLERQPDMDFAPSLTGAAAFGGVKR